jgi:uncharacterized protein (DUF1684 family)
MCRPDQLLNRLPMGGIFVVIGLLCACAGCSRSVADRSGIAGPITRQEKKMDDPALRLPADYHQQITQWRVTHEERFKSPTGWLALINHHWLEEGVNTFGTDSDADLVLPQDVQGSPQGKFIVKGNLVTLETDENSGILVNGEPFRSVSLTIDTLLPESDGEDTIAIGDRLQLQLVRRANQFAIRVRDKESPAIREFRGKKWFGVKPEYRVVAKFTPYEPPRSISIVNVKGQVVPSKLSGRLDFSIGDQAAALDALADTPDELFIVFKDRTNGDTTYPSGRFVVTELPVDGRVILDFNKAYNPPCAFSPHTLCPLPPEQNVLDVAIVAGELFGVRRS